MIVSPCISICKTDPKTGYCYGCGRNTEEKKIWKLEDTTDEWKKENLEIIQKSCFSESDRHELYQAKNACQFLP